MKVERLQQIRVAAESGEAGMSELLEICTEMFISQNKHNREIKLRIEALHEAIERLGDTTQQIADRTVHPIFLIDEGEAEEAVEEENLFEDEEEA